MWFCWWGRGGHYLLHHFVIQLHLTTCDHASLHCRAIPWRLSQSAKQAKFCLENPPRSAIKDVSQAESYGLVSHSHDGLVDSRPDMRLVCISPQKSGLICPLIQMSNGNVETILGDNLAGVKSQKPVFWSHFSKLSSSHTRFPRSTLIGDQLGTKPLSLPQ